MVTLKLIDSSSVPSDETGKALSQALQHSFAAPWPVIYLDKDTWSASRNILSKYLLAIGRSQAFWYLGSTGKEAPPLASIQDSTASASPLVSTILVLETIISNSPQ